jgi:prepilin-type N-terminal cleavage/methylation domain-containing protein
MTAYSESISPSRRLLRERGFTLIELMVVIGIIVVILALAVPLFSVLRGGRSVDAGQNIVSATLQRARARAIWLQDRRGVLFFDDQTTGKTAMLMVRVIDGVGTLALDEQNQEAEYLPVGIGAASIWPRGGGNSSGGGSQDRYRPFGLVMFDGLGRTDTIHYRLATNTDLGTQYKLNLDGSGLNVFTGIGTGKEQSEVAMVLFDRRLLAEQGAPASAYQYSTAQQDWLDNNALALVVNRYNGTLLRAE